MPFILLLSRLPLSILYILSDILFFISYRVIRYRREIIHKNLTKSFPAKSQQEIRAIQRDFYSRFCDHAVETIKLLTISKEELTKRMVLHNADLIRQYQKSNQPFFCFSSHQFNWEWLLASISIESPIPVWFVYQPQQNRFADQLLLRARTHFPAHAIERKRVSREVIKRKDQLQVICVVADQFPGHGNDKKYWARFLNQETAFFKGVSQLAHKLEYPVICTKVKRIKRGYYQSALVKIGDPPHHQNGESVLENYVQELEKMILDDMPGWLWSHNRWKHKRETGR